VRDEGREGNGGGEGRENIFRESLLELLFLIRSDEWHHSLLCRMEERVFGFMTSTVTTRGAVVIQIMLSW
jgi:hypothetical protein